MHNLTHYLIHSLIHDLMHYLIPSHPVFLAHIPLPLRALQDHQLDIFDETGGKGGEMHDYSG
jgi:hypothetical protein